MYFSGVCVSHRFELVLSWHSGIIPTCPHWHEIIRRPMTPFHNSHVAEVNEMMKQQLVGFLGVSEFFEVILAMTKGTQKEIAEN